MHKVPLPGDDPKTRLKDRARDRIYRFLLADGRVRGFLIHGTRLVREMRANHGLGVLETLVLGHAYLGALLMARNLKNEGRLLVNWECGGPIEGLSVEADTHGTVRGYLKQVPIPVEAPLESFDLSSFFGPGFLSVQRREKGMKEPVSSRVMLHYGNVAQDLASFYRESEQAPTVVSLSIQFDKAGEVTGAGGLLLQALPGTDETLLARLEETVGSLPSLGASFADRIEAEAWILSHFVGYQPRILESGRAEFSCPCNKDSVGRVLRSLGEKDRQDIRLNGPWPLEVTCHNCQTRYSYSREEVEEILSGAEEGGKAGVVKD